MCVILFIITIYNLGLLKRICLTAVVSNCSSVQTFDVFTFFFLCSPKYFESIALVLPNHVLYPDNL